tara:strand:- start:977 stop:1363 length:387 start_codon:yes stop_codon:yes gene_type:complete
MKKITLIMLVAIVPFFTMAQKRSKTNESQGKVERNISNYYFMVIKGNTIKSSGSLYSTADTRNDVKLKITFDTGGLRMNDLEDLSQVQYKSMAHAVNSAGRLGWDFVSANVLLEQGAPVYYYYMKKRR